MFERLKAEAREIIQFILDMNGNKIKVGDTVTYYPPGRAPESGLKVKALATNNKATVIRPREGERKKTIQGSQLENNKRDRVSYK